MSKKAAPERITLTFDLHDLPTAQHRAGLGGLILQIDSMGPDGNKRDPRNIPEVEVTHTTATITFTPDSMQGVFNDVYDAVVTENVVEKKRAGKAKPKPGNYSIKRKEKNGEVRSISGFAYDDVEPTANCLRRHLQPDARPWLLLWQKAIWEIPRGGNNVNSRTPFNERAEGKPCEAGAAAWKQLCDVID